MSNFDFDFAAFLASPSFETVPDLSSSVREDKLAERDSKISVPYAFQKRSAVGLGTGGESSLGRAPSHHASSIASGSDHSAAFYAPSHQHISQIQGGFNQAASYWNRAGLIGHRRNLPNDGTAELVSSLSRPQFRPSNLSIQERRRLSQAKGLLVPSSTSTTSVTCPLHADKGNHHLNEPLESSQDKSHRSKVAAAAVPMDEDCTRKEPEEKTKWARFLLSGSADLIYVLSLRGVILYVSPSAEQLLGHTPVEMAGKNISTYCHPFDVIPVLRELKQAARDSTDPETNSGLDHLSGTMEGRGQQIDMAMRMKQKDGAYQWLESVGQLHLHKGKKLAVFSGRIRPVYDLPWDRVCLSLECKTPGFWSKISKIGLILGTFGSTEHVLGLPQGSTREGTARDFLIGNHLKDVINSEALDAFHDGLQQRKETSITHFMKRKSSTRPPVLVHSTLIPSSSSWEAIPFVFIYTLRADAPNAEAMQASGSQDKDPSLHSAAAGSSDRQDRSESTFEELSTNRSSNWMFEFQQLKMTNKRLREAVSTQQRKRAA